MHLGFKFVHPDLKRRRIQSELWVYVHVSVYTLGVHGVHASDRSRICGVILCNVLFFSLAKSCPLGRYGILEDCILNAVHSLMKTKNKKINAERIDYLPEFCCVICKLVV